MRMMRSLIAAVRKWSVNSAGPWALLVTTTPVIYYIISDRNTCLVGAF